MASVCLYFHVHQPLRLRRYTIFDSDPDYFDNRQNRDILLKVTHKCYLPANQVLLDLIRRYEGRFKVSFSVTGAIIEQFRRWAPEVLDSFVQLAETGSTEFIAETYHHSLAFLYSREEFAAQVAMQRQVLHDTFGADPQVFRNTELVYSNEVAQAVAAMGYSAVLCEGADHLLTYRSPNFVYCPPGQPDMRLLLKNYRLSDDIAFRFSNRTWSEWPMTAEKFAGWVNQVNGNGYAVNLFMDYETLGEHQWADTGIFDFLYHLPEEIFKHPDNDFRTPSEVARGYPVVGEYDVPVLISWADTERDLTAWLGNSMQTNAIHELYCLEECIKQKGDEQLLEDWRRLQTSDHFYYMCTKYFADGDVHKYFNPYQSPYDSYINYMNILDSIRSRIPG